MAPVQHGGAKKMRLMVDSEYERFVSGNLPKPHPFVVGANTSSSSGGSVPAIARPESEILNDKKLGDDQKWKIISEQLHRMLQMTSEQRKRPLRVQIQTDEDAGNSAPAAVSVKNSEKSASRLPNFIAKIPKNLWQKAANVIHRLKESADIDWDSRGKVYIDGDEIDGSHIADLVKFTLRTARTVGNPPDGWDAFCTFLVQVGIEPSLISNTQLKQLLVSHSSKNFARTPEEQRTVAKRGDPTTPSRLNVSSTSSPTPKKKKKTPHQTRNRTNILKNLEASIQHGSGRRRIRRGGSQKTKKKWKKVRPRSSPITGERYCKRSSGGGAAKRIRWKAFG
jgi:hypothetical protein